MFFNGGMIKPSVVHQYHRILLSTTEDYAINNATIWMNFNGIIPNEKNKSLF